MSLIVIHWLNYKYACTRIAIASYDDENRGQITGKTETPTIMILESKMKLYGWKTTTIWYYFCSFSFCSCVQQFPVEWLEAFEHLNHWLSTVIYQKLQVLIEVHSLLNNLEQKLERLKKTKSQDYKNNEAECIKFVHFFTFRFEKFLVLVNGNIVSCLVHSLVQFDSFAPSSIFPSFHQHQIR